MWACQKALHAISGMTALKQSQLVVQTRRGRRSVTVVMVLECGIADPPPPVSPTFEFPRRSILCAAFKATESCQISQQVERRFCANWQASFGENQQPRNDK